METPCQNCIENREIAEDALATLRAIKEKYGLGDRHVMREKNKEIEDLKDRLNHIHSILLAKDRDGHDLSVGSTAFKSCLRWSSIHMDK